MSTRIRDLHVQALQVVAGLDAAILAAPHTHGSGTGGVAHVKQLGVARRDAQRMVDLTGEEDGLEQEFGGPDYKEMLYEILGEVQLTSGRQWAATADEHGVRQAVRALAETVPLLGKSPDQTSRLLAAVKSAMSDTASEWVPLVNGERHPPQRTQCIPREGEIVMLGETKWVASRPQHSGMSCVVPLAVHRVRVPTAKPPKPRPALGELRGDELEGF